MADNGHDGGTAPPPPRDAELAATVAETEGALDLGVVQATRMQRVAEIQQASIELQTERNHIRQAYRALRRGRARLTLVLDRLEDLDEQVTAQIAAIDDYNLAVEEVYLTDIRAQGGSPDPTTWPKVREELQQRHPDWTLENSEWVTVWRQIQGWIQEGEEELARTSQ